jgi:hypothetical protein
VNAATRVFYSLARNGLAPRPLVYMLICAGCIRHYVGPGRSSFNPLLHVVMPIAGIVLFFFPLYYQFVKAPPTYPVKAANWIAPAWLVIGLGLAVWLARARRDKLQDIERVYVEDDTVEPAVRV